MGMSAAQARLLSITTRLNNNEFRSQTITNSKLRLADKSSIASQEYMDALNSQKLVYSYFDDNGESNQLNMTPGLIYTYSPLKNQYALMNSSGKILVSAKDKENFEDSNDLAEFLGKYNLYKSSVSIEKYNRDMEAYEAAMTEFTRLHGIWETEHEEYLRLQTQWQSDYEKYQEALNRKDLYGPFTNIVGTSEAPLSCYGAAKSGYAWCFTHLLDYLINYTVARGRVQQNLVTTTGKNFTTDNNGGATLDGESNENKAVFEEISKELNKINCDGHDNDNYKTEGASKYNLLEAKKQNGLEITEFDRLKSDYIETADGYTLKTLEQKAIDMYYIIQYRNDFKDENGNTLITSEMMNELLDNFTDGDMKKIQVDPPGEPPVAPTEPLPPIPPQKPEYEIVIDDKDKAQWYVNLWHMMNGSETANLVQDKEYKYQNSEDSDDILNEIIFVVENSAKNPQTKNYAVFDDNLINNSDWLQFALEHGIVSLAKAEFVDPSADSGKTPELTSKGITWKSTIFTNAVDFKYVDDNVAIAIAEVKYKNAMREIENQDKKYDQDLKKLDTEHTAMQTEYDSIKEAMNKNVERSFKAFS